MSTRRLEAGISESTAMFAFFGDAADRSAIPFPEVVEICHQRDVPVLVDAAAERPDVPNVYLSQGADALCCRRQDEVPGGGHGLSRQSPEVRKEVDFAQFGRDEGDLIDRLMAQGLGRGAGQQPASENV